jgi:hypothetical protein
MEGQVNKIKLLAKELYLEYVNEYLTIEKIAEHYEVSEQLMKELIIEGKELYENQG